MTENKPNFSQLFKNLESLIEYKNVKYGNSALDPINIFTGKCKFGYRIDDKISRIKHSEVLRKNDCIDLIGYLILLCKEQQWENFDDLKD